MSLLLLFAATTAAAETWTYGLDDTPVFTYGLDD